MSEPDSDPAYADGEITATLLSYLQNHPQAADTLQGIVAWWLPQQRYIAASARIEAVLHRLVDTGALHRHALPDGAVLYSLHAAQRPPTLRH
ncbi:MULTISPECIES: hypothetical protein [unclassified Xanthomonas]|uniref:hypothetical protein n=1 Tax=unclassified Xanthomonas TaxID=2643310 RepID=UPI0016395204|nr:MULTISPECIES: hypothetical protein [unclassified Xanthomonas]QNH14590.1 hypothetical protein HEP75_04063 [Xanthomonas sp. SI]QNH18822.1 hypothetical protein HEP74_03998 [Xanthomonas sp. SS]